MTAVLSERALAGAGAAAARYHRLVLIVGPPRTGKTRALLDLASKPGRAYVNVNLELTGRLLDLTRTQRALHTPRILSEIVAEQARDLALLDNIEVLFAVALQQDPLRTLQALSRHRTIVASWPGRVVGHRLTYAEAGHPEHRQYEQPDAVLVTTDAPQGTGRGRAFGIRGNTDEIR